MGFHGLGESRGYAPFDRRYIDSQQYAWRGGMVASIADQRGGQCQRPPDRYLQRIDEHQCHRDRDDCNRRDRSADTLSLADHTFDAMLDDDPVEPSPSNAKGIGDNNAAVGSQIIPDIGGILIKASVGEKNSDRCTGGEVASRMEVRI